MANQSNLTQAKKVKNDEFYTQYRDIEKEVAAYVEYNNALFRDKTILLPRDDPEWSNFTKFFAQNFISRFRMNGNEIYARILIQHRRSDKGNV